MTNKRFTLGDYSNGIQEVWDRERYFCDVDVDNAEKLIETLNNFQELSLKDLKKIEELEQEVKTLRYALIHSAFDEVTIYEL